MDKLKQLLQSKKKEVEEVAGGQKYHKKTDIEVAKLNKLREEEAREREEKERKRKRTEDDNAANTIKYAKPEAVAPEESPRLLPKEEVIRRLRALGQPATLFGEEEIDRLTRLKKAEVEVNLEDETVGGQQENVLLELQRQDKKSGGAHKSSRAEAKADKDGDGKEDGKDAGEGDGAAEEDPVMAAFKAAAAKVADQRAEESMEIEDRIAKYIKKWVGEWEADLEARSDEAKSSGAGRQSLLVFKQTQKYFTPLYQRLRARQLDPELRAGLWMIVKSMRDRNYLYAYDVYLKLAIGNAPWPIGVTSVGIHERSAREKISHVMNQSGQAHIMNDEATRKYLQALKRLITFVQRIYPAPPSRSVDFNAVPNEARGATGGGSDKLALLEAEERGELLYLPPAVNFMESDGSVRVPPKWKNILAREGVEVDDRTRGIEGGNAPPRHRPNTPPLGNKTPPR